MNWQVFWQTKQHRWLSVLVVFIVCMGGGIYLLWRPVWQQWPSASAQHIQHEKLRHDKHRYIGLLKKQHEFDALLPVLAQQQTVLKWLSHQLALLKINIVAWQPDEKTFDRKKMLTIMPVSMTLLGSYQKIRGWLTRLQKQLLFRLDYVDMHAGADKKVNIHLQMTIFFQPGRVHQGWPAAQKVQKHLQMSSGAVQDPFFPMPNEVDFLQESQANALLQYSIKKMTFLGQILIGQHHYGLVNLPNQDLVSLQKGSVIGRMHWRITGINSEYLQLKNSVGETIRLG